MLSGSSAPDLRSLASDGSGHPLPVPLPRFPWRTRVGVPLTIVAGLVLLVGWSAKEAFLPATDVRVVPVVMRPTTEAVAASGDTLETSPSSKGSAVAQAAGWIEPAPYAIGVAAQTDGFVREILVLEGQSVRAGEVLVRLIDDDAKLAVDRAEAELALRQAELDAAQSRWDHPIELDRALAFTAASADETRAELSQLASQIVAEDAREKELVDQLRRIEPLAAAKAATVQELQTTRSRLEAQRATLDAMKARRSVLEAQLAQRTADAKAAAANAELRIDDKRQLNVATAATRLAEAQLAEARLRLQRTEVRSPADGVVMSLLVEPGTKLMLGADSPMAVSPVGSSRHDPK